MKRDVFAMQMATFAESAAPDELAVVAKVAERMHAARGVYGALELGRDGRDLRGELAAEAFDGMAYAAMLLVRGEREVAGG